MPELSAASPAEALGWFERLRAENEPWLKQVFVPPAGLETFLEPRSMVITGAPGSGKTALRYELRRRLQASGQALVVEWLPEPPESDLDERQLSVFARRQLAGALAEALLHLLGAEPERLRHAPAVAWRGLALFLTTYLPGDPASLAALHADQYAPEAPALLGELLELPEKPGWKPPWKPDATLLNALAYWVQALKFASLSTVWVLVDGLGKPSSAYEQRLNDMLLNVLDTLAAFDTPGLVYKLLVPQHLSRLYSQAAGIYTWRMESHDLAWQAERLADVVARRYAAAQGVDPAAAGQLLPAKAELFAWLNQQAAPTPRDWLRQAASRLLAAESPAASLGAGAPRLYYDAQLRRFYLGNQGLDLSEQVFGLLLYLYENRGRLCSRQELYYRQMLGLEYIPSKVTDPAYIKEDWNGAFDMRIKRLREALQTEPGSPAYLENVPRRGYRLLNTL